MREAQFSIIRKGHPPLDVFEMEHLGKGYVRCLVRKPQPPVIDEDARVARPAPPVYQWRRIPDRHIAHIVELGTETAT